MLHPLPLPLSSCLGCIPPLIGLPSLRFYAVGSSLFLLSVCFCLCSLFYRDDVLCWLLLARPFLYAFHAHLRFPVDLVWFRLSCDHGWIRSGSVNVRKQQQQQQLPRVRRHRASKPKGSSKRVLPWQVTMCVCVCVSFPFILDIKFVRRTSRGHTGGRSHRIFHPPFCGACLNFSREKDSAIPFPRRPLSQILCANDLIVLHPLGIFIFVFQSFSEKNPVCRDRTHVPTCQRVTRYL